MRIFLLISIVLSALASHALELNGRELSPEIAGNYVADGGDCPVLLDNEGIKYFYRRLDVQVNDGDVVLLIDRDKQEGNGIRFSSPVRRVYPAVEGAPGTNHSVVGRNGLTYTNFKDKKITELQLDGDVLILTQSTQSVPRQAPETVWECRFDRSSN